MASSDNGETQWYQPVAGLSNVGSYQVSSIPYLTHSVAPAYGSTPVEIKFPSVTRFVNIKNIDPTNRHLRVGFSANGVNQSNYIVLTQYESYTADFKVTSVFIVSEEAFPVSASISAGLTGIHPSNLPNNWSGSAGVG